MDERSPHFNLIRLHFFFFFYKIEKNNTSSKNTSFFYHAVWLISFRKWKVPTKYDGARECVVRSRCNIGFRIVFRIPQTFRVHVSKRNVNRTINFITHGNGVSRTPAPTGAWRAFFETTFPIFRADEFFDFRSRVTRGWGGGWWIGTFYGYEDKYSRRTRGSLPPHPVWRTNGLHVTFEFTR